MWTQISVKLNWHLWRYWQVRGKYLVWSYGILWIHTTYSNLMIIVWGVYSSESWGPASSSFSRSFGCCWAPSYFKATAPVPSSLSPKKQQAEPFLPYSSCFPSLQSPTLFVDSLAVLVLASLKLSAPAYSSSPQLYSLAIDGGLCTLCVPSCERVGLPGACFAKSPW